MHEEALERAVASLQAAPLSTPVRQRLVASLRKAWGPPGALTPPQLAAGVAAELELTEPDGIVAIVGLFYTAVDLSDDVADGDAPPEAIGDPERLLLWLPEAAWSLDPERGPAALRTLNRGGLAMWEAQDEDLAARGRVITPEQAWAIAEGKAGREVAAVFATVAEAAGAETEPWEQLGRPFGIALQVMTDLADFAKGGPDWSARQPAWPLAVALAHPQWGEATQFAWGGAHHTTRRRELGCALMTASRDIQALDALATTLQDHSVGLPAAAPLVEQLLERLSPWQNPPEPGASLGDDPEPLNTHARARAAGEAFLRADPSLLEAIEHHELPLWGRPRVSAPTFGRLLAAWAARQSGIELAPAWESLTTKPALGYRYFPDIEEVALDVDLAGWLLTAGLGGQQIVRALEQAVPQNLPTWLGPATASDGTPLTPHPCVASMASASRGLHAVGSPMAEEAWERTLRMRQLVGPVSPYYPPHTVDALLVDGAHHCALGAERVEASVEFLTASIGLSGLWGDLWATAVATPALLSWNQHPLPASTHRALIDSLEADGGAPPVPAWQTLPLDGRDTWFQSRRLVTAFVVRALDVLGVPSVPRPPPAPSAPLKVADV